MTQRIQKVKFAGDLVVKSYLTQTGKQNLRKQNL